VRQRGQHITACPLAGVAADEIFDVTPYADALTRHLLRHPLSSKLPRKFKIGFEGCPDDHTRTGINDIGFRAALGPDGAHGFRVTVAGGTSIMPRAGALLHDFLPAGRSSTSPTRFSASTPRSATTSTNSATVSSS
jgi:sulfite reductase (NADPH) hemoprotein beta-component